MFSCWLNSKIKFSISTSHSFSFYNPVQVLNRDLSILFIQLFGELRKRQEEELATIKPE